MITTKKDIIDYLNMLFKKDGIQSLLERKLIKSTCYNNIKKLNTKNIDFHEFCSMLIDKYDDYIMFISICND